MAPSTSIASDLPDSDSDDGVSRAEEEEEEEEEVEEEVEEEAEEEASGAEECGSDPGEEEEYEEIEEEVEEEEAVEEIEEEEEVGEEEEGEEEEEEEVEEVAEEEEEEDVVEGVSECEEQVAGGEDIEVAEGEDQEVVEGVAEGEVQVVQGEEQEEVDMDLDSSVEAIDEVQAFSQDMKAKEIESQLKPQGSANVAPSPCHVEDTASHFTFSGCSHAPLAMQGDNLGMNNGHSKNIEDEKGSNASGDRNEVCKDEVMETKPSEESSIRGLPNFLGAKDDVDVIAEQVKHTPLPSDNGIQQPVLSNISLSRSRNLSVSPSPELNNVNKRQAIICDFFAKGWCIKGSSCRFLHVKNKTSSSGEKQAEGDAAVASSSGDRINEGSTNIRPRLHDLKEPAYCLTGKDAITSRFSFDSQMAAQMGGKLISSSSILLEDIPGGITLNSRQFPASKDAPVFSAAIKDVGAGNLTGGWPPNDHRSHAFPLNGGSSFLLNDSLLNRCTSSGSAAKSRTYHSKNSGFLVNNLDNSTRKRSVCMDDDCVGTTPPSSEHKLKVSCDDWEPSVPFQPSFIIMPVVSSPGRQYDPLRDSNVVHSGVDKSFKFSFISNRISSQKASRQPTNGASFPNGDKSSVPFDSRFHGSSSANNGGPPEKDTFNKSGGEVMDIDDGLADDHSGTMPKEEIASVSNQLDVDEKPGSDGSRCRNNFTADNLDDGGKMDQEVQKESKSPRHFRAALIDYVKELLKPIWREGHLSKDAHNTIVRKSVEKVLSTMQSHQMPTTSESIKHYLHFSRTKIAKLVEGYSSRYGKS
ncbi:unnamed protein product [Linum tenue]|uniref:C3H1-type domain-containing protein n=1 Tax=Linum tenue TaxID=586396 RepID=A0AAV0PCK3_9ROSI|nr:unnamed protein product [Linum tenue]